MSVIIPNYNHTRYLPEAISSVLSQSYRSFEIIVVDDGSTDNCREVVASFGEQVRYIWQENQGLAGARNTGIRAAQGALIGLLDADDQWLPGFLINMVSLTKRHPEAAVYYSCARGMDSEGKDLPQLFGKLQDQKRGIYQTLLRANFIIPSTVVLRRSEILAAGLFDQNLRSCEDWDLWLRLLPDSSFAGTTQCLVRYRLHSESLSKNIVGMRSAVRAVVEKQFGPDNGQPADWPVEKRRAFGGVHRYNLLTAVQYQEDWGRAAGFLRLALETDPELASDLELFYDLALGCQPAGYRGSRVHLDLEENAGQIADLLHNVFSTNFEMTLAPIKRQTFGTAYQALGLVAYNSGLLALSRRYLIKALIYRPDLWHNRDVAGNLVKSFLGSSVLSRIRRYKSLV